MFHVHGLKFKNSKLTRSRRFLTGQIPGGFQTPISSKIGGMLPPALQRLHSWRGLRFDVVPSTFEENLDKSLFPTPVRTTMTKSIDGMMNQEHYVMENAKQKAVEVFQRLNAQGTHVDLVIGCDTVVAHDGKILEKPKMHSRCSQLSLVPRTMCFLVLPCVSRPPSTSFVSVRPSRSARLTARRFEVVHAVLSAVTLLNVDVEYIATGEPMDKAGSYGLQGRAKAFVASLDGCSNNVIGFPVDRFCVEIARFLH
ncbi:hypothetical protein DYB32_002466 [Aphanomyces invadans]|uniref:Maf-like protein n=1 Tax=Aphanomyces invadans TaxID=157072 RepID=A0A418B3B8_9STRA|nr:hypothetical protein DYB32_002466 [Aphanomyces invadans]